MLSLGACIAAFQAASLYCPEPVQATLSSLVERLARDHPHHVVHTVLALKNGDRGRDGRAGPGRGASAEALQHNADLDKVAAAQDVLQRTSAQPALYALPLP